MKRWTWVAVLVLAVPGVARADADTDAAAALRNEVGFTQNLGVQVPGELEFREDHGAMTHLGDYFGDKPIVLILAYYRCPMLCTQVLNGVVDALNSPSFRLRLGEDFHIVTVSFDAREHNPELMRLVADKKRHYTAVVPRHPHAKDGWHFLTGEQPAIDALTKAVGFRYKFDDKTNQFVHPAGVIVLTPGGKISSYFFNLRYTPLPGEKVSDSRQSSPHDLHLGLVEASQNNVGSLADQAVLLLCHYDPITGTYTTQIMALVRLGGATTALVLGVFLALAWRRDRRKARAGPPGADPALPNAGPV